MDDYSNAHNLAKEGKKKEKEEKEEKKGKKEVKRVTQGEVIVQKTSVGRKFKDMIIEADFQSVGRGLYYNVFIPGIKMLLFNLGSQGIEKAIFGENSNRRSRFMGAGPRTTYSSYQSPIQRTSYPPDPGPIGRAAAIPTQVTSASRSPRNVREDFICASKEDAERVLEQLGDILDQYGVVTVQDLNNTVGWPSEYTDNNWGWDFLGNATIRQTPQGFLIDLPPAQHIQ